MPVSRAVKESQGFTTNHFGRCSICKTPIPEDHLVCECGAMILRVKLQPKQQLILDQVMATGRNVPTKIGFGGSRSAGKSRGARDLALIVTSEMAQLYPGIPVFIMRRNWTQCKENHLEKFKMERPELTLFYGDKQYQFPESMNSPRIVFTYADTPEDVLRIGRGPECYLMLIDQAEQVGEIDLQELNTPNRWPDAGQGAAKSVYYFNPGGIGSSYLQRVFYSKTYKYNENPNDFVFTQSYGFDNFCWFQNEGIMIDGEPLTWEKFYTLPGELPPCVDGVYDQAWLDSVPDNHRFKLFVTQTSEGRKHWSKPDSIRMGDLFGRFDSFSGQYFNIWREDRIVLR